MSKQNAIDKIKRQLFFETNISVVGGLPPGLHICNGIISGTIKKSGRYKVIIKQKN